MPFEFVPIFNLNAFPAENTNALVAAMVSDAPGWDCDLHALVALWVQKSF